MSEKINDGGPAFPLKEPLTSDCLGMSLRDYFAAKAMQSIVALNCCPATMVAEDAYAIADAMLERRENK